MRTLTYFQARQLVGGRHRLNRLWRAWLSKQKLGKERPDGEPLVTIERGVYLTLMSFRGKAGWEDHTYVITGDHAAVERICRQLAAGQHSILTLEDYRRTIGTLA